MAKDVDGDLIQWVTPAGNIQTKPGDISPLKKAIKKIPYFGPLTRLTNASKKSGGHAVVWNKTQNQVFFAVLTAAGKFQLHPMNANDKRMTQKVL